MNRKLKSSLDRIIARRSGALWRDHLVDRSTERQEPEMPRVWSRLWLRRRLGEQHDIPRITHWQE